jgi:hypothetical protein
MTEEHTIKSAAAILGTSEGAIRQRLRRGTLRSVRREGRVYAILDGTEQTGTHESSTLTSEVEALREQVEWLRGEVQRKDAILLNMTEAMKALSPPVQEASPDERESPQTVEEEPEKAEPRSATVEAQEGVQRRPWWRRVFGS